MCRGGELVNLLIEDLQKEEIPIPGELNDLTQSPVATSRISPNFPHPHSTTPFKVIYRILPGQFKTDQYRVGKWLILREETYLGIQAWLQHSQLVSGPIFRGIIGSKNQRFLKVGLTIRYVGQIYKRLAMRAGYSAQLVKGINSHSFRVGAA